jgi:transcriptional regulator
MRVRDKARALAMTQKRESERRQVMTGLKQLRAKAQPGGLTQVEVAALLKVSERTVRNIEKRALRKLRQHRRTADLG